MRFITNLYHIMVAILALGLIVAMFILVVYLLVDGMLAYFWGFDLDHWISAKLGFDWRALLRQWQNQNSPGV